MMRTSIIAATGVRFDETLNLIGGEDVVFFRDLRQRGYSVACAPQAMVSETIPRSRASLTWMRRRWIRAGATSTLLLAGSRGGLKRKLTIALRGLLRISAGSVLVAWYAITRGRRDFAAVARALSTVYRGAGMLMAAFGKAYQEYGSSYRHGPVTNAPVEP
jgi:succinoglycan biosynthesis protein ExoM